MTACNIRVRSEAAWKMAAKISQIKDTQEHMHTYAHVCVHSHTYMYKYNLTLHRSAGVFYMICRCTHFLSSLKSLGQNIYSGEFKVFC